MGILSDAAVWVGIGDDIFAATSLQVAKNIAQAQTDQKIEWHPDNTGTIVAGFVGNHDTFFLKKTVIHD